MRPFECEYDHELDFLFGSFLLNYSINAMHPKTRKILQLLRLRQVGVLQSGSIVSAL
jgi:hypothetical protein